MSWNGDINVSATRVGNSAACDMLPVLSLRFYGAGRGQKRNLRALFPVQV